MTSAVEVWRTSSRLVATLLLDERLDSSQLTTGVEETLSSRSIRRKGSSFGCKSSFCGCNSSSCILVSSSVLGLVVTKGTRDGGGGRLGRTEGEDKW